MSKDYLDALTNKKSREAAERYGVKLIDYGFGRPGEGGIQKKNPKDFGKDAAAAAMNDYDTRRTIEAAAMSGKKKAEQYAKNGFGDLTDVTKANNMFAKMHKRQGNGGDFSSNSDYAGLTYNMVQRDRNKLMDSMSVNDQAAVAKGETDDEPYTPSQELTDARNTVEEFDNKDFQVYNDAQSSDGNDQRQQASNSFLNKYKMNLKSKMKPTLPS